MNAKFNPGQIVTTPGALTKVGSWEMTLGMERHMRGDWGNLDPHDKRVNEDALKHGGRLMSSYVAENGTKFWIITEHDRSVTTILLPDEY